MPELNTPQPLEAVKIDDRTYSIEDNGVRCLLFIGEERAMLVDTGMGIAGSLKTVVESLTDKPVMLVISHTDPDHIGNYREFGAAHIHPSEIPNYFQSVDPDAQVVPIWENDVLDIGGRKFEVVLIPGHTAGCIALLDRENRIIITGDSVCVTPIFMFGEGRSLISHIASLEKLLRMSDAFDEVYPSHGTLPVPDCKTHIARSITAAKKLLAGELTPEEPAFPHPPNTKLYMYDGIGFCC